MKNLTKLGRLRLYRELLQDRTRRTRFRERKQWTADHLKCITGKMGYHTAMKQINSLRVGSRQLTNQEGAE